MRAVRSVAVAISFALPSLSSWADQTLTTDQLKLTGIDAFDIAVEELPEDASQCGVTLQQLKTQVELALRKNGISVSSMADTLYVRLGILFDPQIRSCFFSLEIQIHGFVRRDFGRLHEQRIKATIWQRGLLGTGPSQNTSRQITEALAQLLNDLCNDQLAANRASAQGKSSSQKNSK